MPKRIVYTKITPLPSNVPRQLALDMLHSHAEIIQLNPLVTGQTAIHAPRDAAADEYFAQWYEITEIITWGFGMRKKISFKGVFHDMPWGLQTHIYAPMGVDMRNKYQIRGNQPGEPREVRELGLDAPSDGLYLREDVEITCNIALASFVKKEAKSATAVMVERLNRKAELLDEGILHAMFENGKLKTLNPTQLQQPRDALKSPALGSSPSISSSPGSPPSTQGEFGPEKTYIKYHDLPGRMDTKRPVSHLGPQELYARPVSGYSGSIPSFSNAIEMEGSTYYAQDPSATSFRSELADTSLPVDNKHASYHSNIDHQMSGYTQHRTSQPPASLPPQHSPMPHRLSASNSYNPNTSPIPAPLQPRRESTRSSIQVPSGNYVITNPDTSRHSTSSYDASNQRQPSYSSASAQLHPSSRTSADPTGLANQVQGLGLVDAPTARDSALEPTTSPSQTTKCPICGDFEGDSVAVSHHVNRTHFGSS